MKCCSVCGQALPDYAAFCGACGGPAVEVNTAPTTAEAPKKKRRWLLPVLISVVVLMAAAVVGFFTNWFGLVSPLYGLGKAIAKTGSAESLTVKATVKYTYEDGDTDKETASMRIVLDADKEEIYYVSESEDTVTLFDDGNIYYYNDPADEDDPGYAYIREGESAGKKYFDAYNDIYDGKNIDWEEWVEYAELEDYVKANKVEDFIKEVNKEYLRDSDWLEDNFGFEKHGNVYVFEPDLESMGEEIIDIVGDSRAFTNEAKDAVEDVMEEMIDAAEDGDVSVRISFTVKSGVLSAISIKATDGDAKVEYTIEITDVNKTSITSKEMNSIRDKVEEMIEENTCSECGESLWWMEEDDYHGDCSFCDNHGDLSYTVEGSPSCYDCYYDATHRCEVCGASDADYSYDGYDPLCTTCYYSLRYGYDYCDICGEFENMYDYYGYELCWDCYYDLKYGY